MGVIIEVSLIVYSTHAMSSGVKCLIRPDKRINTAIAFRMINARSFHKRPTHNHPKTPTKDKQRSKKGNPCVDLTANAAIRKLLATHFTYHERSCLGVALLNILLLFSISFLEYFI